MASMGRDFNGLIVGSMPRAGRWGGGVGWVSDGSD